MPTASPDAANSDASAPTGTPRRIFLLTVLALCLAYEQVPSFAQYVDIRPVLPWVVGVTASLLLADLLKSLIGHGWRRCRSLVAEIRRLRQGFNISYGPESNKEDGRTAKKDLGDLQSQS